MHSKNLSLNGCLRWATVGMRYVVDQCTIPPLSRKWIYARHVATILIYYSPLRLRHFLDFVILEWLYFFHIHTNKSDNSLQIVVLHFMLLFWNYIRNIIFHNITIFRKSRNFESAKSLQRKSRNCLIVGSQITYLVCNTLLWMIK